MALVTIFAIPMAIICFYPLLMTKFGTVSLGMAYTAILGFFLLGCANLAIGVFISSLTESQVIAAVLTFILLFAFYMMNGISSFFSEGALSTCITFGLLILAAAIIIYTMIKNLLISRSSLRGGRSRSGSSLYSEFRILRGRHPEGSAGV